MDRRRQIDALAESQEERMLLVRVLDKLERGEARQIPVATGFLSPREQALVRQIFPQCSFFGGTAGAQRQVACYVPEYMTLEDYFEDGPIACIQAKFYEENALAHRDMLGALMGAGIRRDAVGDIIVREKSCEFFLLSELTKYLLDNLTSAGRHHLQLAQVDPKSVEKPPQDMKMLRVTVSSLRFDSVISAAFHISRGKAVELIQAGKASLNSLTCLKADKTAAVLDEISVRGLGKLRILELHGQTKKDRTAITVGIYV